MAVLPRRRTLSEQRIELVELGLRVVPACEPGRALHVADDRMERAVGVLRRTEIAHADMRLAHKPLQQRRGQSRLADAGLAREQGDLSFARFRLGPAPKQEFALLLAPDEGGEVARMQRLEAALLRTGPQRSEGARRPSHAFEVLRAKVPQLEQVPEQLAGALGYDDVVGFGDAL